MDRIEAEDEILLETTTEHMAQRLGPVSYTHLRAHETVLDIVCRLLLEKKQINASYFINTTHL
mgnify:CR=1 FL=1